MRIVVLSGTHAPDMGYAEIVKRRLRDYEEALNQRRREK